MKILQKIAIYILLLGGLASCDDCFLFEDMEDCVIKNNLRFVYDMNLKWADAFASEVKSVRVYVFDEQEILVKTYMENGPQVDEAGFEIPVDLPEGRYRFVAWCGIDNRNVESQSFFAPDYEDLKYKDLYCKLLTETNSLHETISDRHLQFMYYGELVADIKTTGDSHATYYHTIHLVKDTNHIRVQLVQLSGEPVYADDFVYSIEDANGLLDYSNLPVGDTMITYYPWQIQNAEVGMETKGNMSTSLSAIADLDVSRMIADRKRGMKLSIRNGKTNELIASIPIIDYALLAKDYYETAYGHPMSNQEFLDREDEYSLTFFLDDDMKWISSFIYINSWRVVLQEHDFE